MIFVIFVAFGIAYNTLVVIAAMRFPRRAKLRAFRPPVSILKPVKGCDPDFYRAIASHAAQDYPTFEILFGVADPDDPAVSEIERLQADYPSVPIRVVPTANDAANRKAGGLELLARQARYDVMLVNDGDIRVDPDYLARVITCLEDDAVGLATCLYRGRGSSLASEAEALGIATEFAPSVMVARLLSNSGFALGATMAFRRRELDRIGGFAAIRDYLADDYQLGARIAALGKRVAISDSIVETNMGAGTWTDVWKHQVRWSRTIRVSRPGGYFGYLVTQATFWCVIAALAGHPTAALAGLLVRLIAAGAAMRTLNFRSTIALAIPLRDLFGFAVWAAGMFGNTVEWRGTRFRLHPDGRITPLKPRQAYPGVD